MDFKEYRKAPLLPRTFGCAKIKQETAIDWTECDLIETVPDKMGGRPIIKGTRTEPATLVTDFELGSSMEEIYENFPTVPIATVRKVIAFAQHQPVA